MTLYQYALKKLDNFGLILSVAFSALSIAFLAKDPYQWIWGLRFSVLFTPYAPAYRDVLAYCLFYLALRTKLPYDKRPVAFFTAWALDESIGALVFVSQTALFFSRDPYYFYKLPIFVISLVIALILCRKQKVKFQSKRFILFLPLFVTYFVLSLLFTFDNYSAPAIVNGYHYIYLLIFYLCLRS